jgi:hypothetical protein
MGYNAATGIFFSRNLNFFSAVAPRLAGLTSGALKIKRSRALLQLEKAAKPHRRSPSDDRDTSFP